MILVRADLACHAADVRPGTLRQWVRRGHITRPIRNYYDLEEILALIDQRHAQRADRCTRVKNV